MTPAPRLSEPSRSLDVAADRLAFRLSYAIGALAVLAINTVNVFTLLSDAAGRGDWRRIAINEYTSGAVTLMLAGLVWLAATQVPLTRDRWRVRLGTHLIVSVVYAALHVAGLIVLRRAAFAFMGMTDRYAGFQELIYEWRKDLLVYGAAVGLVTLVRLAISARKGPADAAGKLLEIRDGRRVLRVPGSRVVAARAAGNYVEMILLDGRRPLVRATLNALTPELASHGLVRVHRSWMVNPTQVRQIDSLSGGNRRLTLEGGLMADCSRRYARALANSAIADLPRSSR